MVVEAAGFSVVRQFVGHGIGEVFHGPPQIPHYHERALTTLMEPGMVFTIEPMITMGSIQPVIWSDGWTAATSDGSRTAQFEHTLVVTESGAEILTLPTPAAPDAAAAPMGAVPLPGLGDHAQPHGADPRREARADLIRR